METTYVLNRFGKWFCWFTMLLSGTAIAGVLFAIVRIAQKLLAGLNPGKQEIGIGGIFCFVLFGILFITLIIQAAKVLNYRVTLSKEGVQVGDKTIMWQEIQSLYHPVRTYGLAFRIMTRSGRAVEVYPVENVRELENLIKERLTESEVGIDSVEQAIEYVITKKWCVWLFVVQIASAGGMALAFMGLVAHISGGSGFDDLPRIIKATPLGVFPVALIILNVLLSWTKRVSAFRVTVFEQAIGIGGLILKWSDIKRIEQARWPLAFVLHRREGPKVGVYSGIENVGSLEQIIRDRLELKTEPPSPGE